MNSIRWIIAIATPVIGIVCAVIAIHFGIAHNWPKMVWAIGLVIWASVLCVWAINRIRNE